MKAYSTYQEAKIENPECDIVTTARNWDGISSCIGKFEPMKTEGLGSHLVDDNTAWTKCNPADYCMTIEKFLSDGNKFVKGDIAIDVVGYVHVIDDCALWNDAIEKDSSRFILRAAALENKESDYDRGISEFIQAMPKSLRDGIYDGPAVVVESMVNQPKKPRTRVEYVKCDFSQAWEAVKAFEGGQVFYRDANSMIPTNEVNYVAIELVVDVLVFNNAGNLYRKVETEIDERQEFIDAAYKHFQSIGLVTETLGKMFDSGKFKYTGE